MRQAKYPLRLFWLALAFALTAHAATTGEGLRILNLEDFVQDLRLDLVYAASAGPGAAPRPLRIAILDNSFTGHEAALGQSLPASTQYHAGPVPTPPHAAEDGHGLAMAQLVYGLMTHAGRLPGLAPAELHLYGTFGYDNFKAAVEDVIQRKIDLVLYAQVWEYGGNGNGTGFIDALVRRATGAGILWVNAAGDFGVSTFVAPIRDGADGWVDLPDPNHGVQLRCEPPAGQKTCGVRIVLSWNDFKDDVSVGTDKDLDLVLVDDTLSVVASSTLQQVRAVSGPGQSLYPREIVTAPDLQPGLYAIRVKDRSHNFGPADRLRLTVTGPAIEMPRRVEGETLLAPADLPQVITVGASDTAMSSESRSLHKPELLTPSLIRGGGSVFPAGSSSSAAAAAAGLALLKSFHPEWSRAELLDAFRLQLAGSGSALSSPLLGFEPAAIGPVRAQAGPAGRPAKCFAPLNPAAIGLPAYAYGALQNGGTLVATSAGPKVLFGEDPLDLLGPDKRRAYPDDAIILGPSGAAVVPRSSVAALGAGYFELAQLPRGSSICGRP